MIFFRTGSTSHNMSSMSGHNMSGDMYARFVQKCQEEYYFLFCQDGGWADCCLSEADVVVPIASDQPPGIPGEVFSFTYLDHFHPSNPLILSRDHFHSLSFLNQLLSAVCSFPGACARRGDFGKRVFSSSTKVFSSCTRVWIFDSCTKNLMMQMSLHHFLQAFPNKNLLFQNIYDLAFLYILIGSIQSIDVKSDELSRVSDLFYHVQPWLICSYNSFTVV